LVVYSVKSELFMKYFMNYEKTITFTGEPAAALDIAKNTFLPNGYLISESTDNSITLKGNNLFWLQQQNNPLIGISKVNIRVENSTVSLKAELGNITKVIIFLIAFIVVLALLTVIIFAIVFAGKENGPNVILLSLLPLAPWPVLAPLIFFFLKYRTCKALDILVNNITTNNL